MPPEMPRDAASDPAAQRKAEQAALRNVRKQLDRMEASDARRRKVIRRIAIIGVAGIACVILVVWYMLSASRDQLRGAPVEIPRSAGKKS